MGTARMKKIYLKQLLDMRVTVILLDFAVCMLSWRMGFANKTDRPFVSAGSWPIGGGAVPSGSPCTVQHATVSLCADSYTMAVNADYSNYTRDNGFIGTTSTAISSDTYYWETVNYSYPNFASFGNHTTGRSTAANISIVNLHAASTGFHFALDDISFSPVCGKNITVNLSSNPTKPVISQN